ncbi:MAG: sialidase family protein [Nitrososphaerales archaeon]
MATINLSKSPGFSSDPQMAVSDSSVYVVWEDFTPGNWEIYVKASKDKGATFGSAINLSESDGESSRPRIAASGNNVYVVWQEFTPQSYDMVFRASVDSGSSFGVPTKLNNDPISSADPRRSDPPGLAVYENSVYVVWVDKYDILFRASTDRGANFGEAISLSGNFDEVEDFFRPHVAVYDNSVYAVWVDNRDILFRASKDNGANFGEATNLSADNKNATAPERSDLPDIAVFGSSVYIVWANYVPGNYDIFFRSSIDNGASFADAIELTNIAGLSDLPHVAVSEKNVNVVWDDYNLAEGLDVFIRTSIDNGATFGNAVNLNRNTGYSTGIPIAVSGNNVYTVSSIGNIDIFFRTSTDGGVSFSKAVNLSNNPAGSSDPSIALSGDNVYVVWEDYSPGNADIFFMTFLPSSVEERLQTMMLSTDSGSVNIEVTIDTDILQTAVPTQFTLKFLNPESGEPLQGVNYSFTITDDKGNSIVNRTDKHAHEGIDTQVVTFSNTGSFTLEVEVEGLGMEKPYDSLHSGKASTLITVVPEFPLGTLIVMGALIAVVTMLTVLKVSVFRSTDFP